MVDYPEVRAAVRPKYLDTVTGEYHGLRNGTRSYEVWHSAGSLATLKGLEDAFKYRREKSGFMTIDDTEWVAVGNGEYLGQNIARIHLDDVKKGDVSQAGTPYTVFVRLDKDNSLINDPGPLDYDSFMKDDRVLMLAGSPENREALAKMLFGAKSDGGEGWSSVGSYHQINAVGFDDTARGRLVFLYDFVNGLYGGYVDSSGRFLGVGDGVAKSDDTIIVSEFIGVDKEGNNIYQTNTGSTITVSLNPIVSEKVKSPTLQEKVKQMLLTELW